MSRRQKSHNTLRPRGISAVRSAEDLTTTPELPTDAEGSSRSLPRPAGRAFTVNRSLPTFPLFNPTPNPDPDAAPVAVAALRSRSRSQHQHNPANEFLPPPVSVPGPDATASAYRTPPASPFELHDAHRGRQFPDPALALPRFSFDDDARLPFAWMEISPDEVGRVAAANNANGDDDRARREARRRKRRAARAATQFDERFSHHSSADSLNASAEGTAEDFTEERPPTPPAKDDVDIGVGETGSDARTQEPADTGKDEEIQPTVSVKKTGRKVLFRAEDNVAEAEEASRAQTSLARSGAPLDNTTPITPQPVAFAPPTVVMSPPTPLDHPFSFDDHLPHPPALADPPSSTAPITLAARRASPSPEPLLPILTTAPDVPPPPWPVLSSSRPSSPLARTPSHLYPPRSPSDAGSDAGVSEPVSQPSRRPWDAYNPLDDGLMYLRLAGQPKSTAASTPAAPPLGVEVATGRVVAMVPVAVGKSGVQAPPAQQAWAPTAPVAVPAAAAAGLTAPSATTSMQRLGSFLRAHLQITSSTAAAPGDRMAAVAAAAVAAGKHKKRSPSPSSGRSPSPGPGDAGGQAAAGASLRDRLRHSWVTMHGGSGGWSAPALDVGTAGASKEFLGIAEPSTPSIVLGRRRSLAPGLATGGSSGSLPPAVSDGAIGRRRSFVAGTGDFLSVLRGGASASDVADDAASTASSSDGRPPSRGSAALRLVAEPSSDEADEAVQPHPPPPQGRRRASARGSGAAPTQLVTTTSAGDIVAPGPASSSASPATPQSSSSSSPSATAAALRRSRTSRLSLRRASSMSSMISVGSTGSGTAGGGPPSVVSLQWAPAVVVTAKDAMAEAGWGDEDEVGGVRRPRSISGSSVASSYGLDRPTFVLGVANAFDEWFDDGEVAVEDEEDDGGVTTDMDEDYGELMMDPPPPPPSPAIVPTMMPAAVRRAESSTSLARKRSGTLVGGSSEDGDAAGAELLRSTSGASERNKMLRRYGSNRSTTGLYAAAGARRGSAAVGAEAEEQGVRRGNTMRTVSSVGRSLSGRRSTTPTISRAGTLFTAVASSSSVSSSVSKRAKADAEGRDAVAPGASAAATVSAVLRPAHPLERVPPAPGLAPCPVVQPLKYWDPVACASVVLVHRGRGAGGTGASGGGHVKWGSSKRRSKAFEPTAGTSVAFPNVGRGASMHAGMVPGGSTPSGWAKFLASSHSHLAGSGANAASASSGPQNILRSGSLPVLFSLGHPPPSAEMLQAAHAHLEGGPGGPGPWEGPALPPAPPSLMTMPVLMRSASPTRLGRMGSAGSMPVLTEQREPEVFAAAAIPSPQSAGVMPFASEMREDDEDEYAVPVVVEVVHPIGYPIGDSRDASVDRPRRSVSPAPGVFGKRAATSMGIYATPADDKDGLGGSAPSLLLDPAADAPRPSSAASSRGTARTSTSVAMASSALNYNEVVMFAAGMDGNTIRGSSSLAPFARTLGGGNAQPPGASTTLMRGAKGKRGMFGGRTLAASASEEVLGTGRRWGGGNGSAGSLPRSFGSMGAEDDDEDGNGGGGKMAFAKSAFGKALSFLKPRGGGSR
ncbi:hypothetical protein HDU96_010702 [Phlyctochytrium bullatum]|nr:hypothetical protein HDU96_010702 [Phlyctochytrium bullatum]